MIMKLLHLDSSVLNDNSVSRTLTAKIANQFRAVQPDIDITYRDLGADAPAHLSADILATRFAPAELWSDEQKREASLTEALLEEFLAADVIIIGAPMYNFSVPTQLKAWIDRIAQVGRTFKYTEKGPVGLAEGKKVIVASSRGGFYSTSEAARGMDFQEDYLRAVLGFLGVTDVSIVRAEGVNMGPEVKGKSLDAADQEIGELLAAAA